MSTRQFPCLLGKCDVVSIIERTIEKKKGNSGHLGVGWRGRVYLGCDGFVKARASKCELKLPCFLSFVCRYNVAQFNTLNNWHFCSSYGIYEKRLFHIIYYVFFLLYIMSFSYYRRSTILRNSHRNKKKKKMIAEAVYFLIHLKCISKKYIHF